MRKLILFFLGVLAIALAAFGASRLLVESEWGFYSLSPSNLTGEKAIHIFPSSPNSDDLRYSTGSAPAWSPLTAENWDGTQFTFETWQRFNLDAGAGTSPGFYYLLDCAAASVSNRVRIYLNQQFVLFYVEDKDAGDHYVAYNADSWVAGEVHHIVCVLDLNADRMELYTDGTLRDDTPTAALSSDSMDDVASTFQFGADYQQNYTANSCLTGRILNRAISAAEVSDLYNSGAGNLDTFLVDADVVWRGNFSDDATSAAFWHRGKAVSAIADGSTDDTLTTASGSDTSFADNDEVLVYDGTGYDIGAKTVADGTISDTSFAVDDGAGADAGAVEDVGVFADLDGDSQYFYRTDADFPESGITGANDLTTEAWLFFDSLPGAATFVSKYQTTGNKRMYAVYVISDEIRIGISSDGTSATSKDTSGMNLVAGKWVHIAVVYDASAGTADFYKNGAFVEQETGLPNSIADKDPPFIVGAYEGASFLAGGVFDVCLFDDKRTAAEILASATNPRLDVSGDANCIGQWIFDEAAAATAIDNLQGDAGRDLIPYDGGDVTFGNCGRTQEAFVTKNLVVDGSMENANIGAWVQGDAATTHAKDTTIAVYDAYSLKVTNGDASQAYARQTVFTTANNDYYFNGWAYGPATVNGTSQLVDIDATAALGITATQAGLAATTWGEVRFCFQAADTSTTVDLGTGSVSNTEIAYWDQVELRENLVAQGGCEAADGNSLPTGWSDTGSPDADETQTDSTDQHAGSTSILLSGADESEGVTQTITVVSGKYYTLTFWEKNNSQDIDVILATAATATIDATGDNTWTKHSYTFLTTGTSLVLRVVSGAASQSGWFDDFSLVKCDTAPASVATKGTGIYPRTNPQIFE